MGDRRGVTLLEIIVALVLGGILTGIMINTFSGARARTATRSAESNFLSLHAQTRTSAVERGALVRLVVDAGANRVSVVAGAGPDADTIRSLDFMSAFNVGVETASSPLELCMNPRGIGDLACTSFASTADVTFLRGGQARTIQLLPLGQVLR